MDIMETSEQPNVTKLFQAVETTKNVCVVMEHSGGGQSLQHILEA